MKSAFKVSLLMLLLLIIALPLSAQAENLPQPQRWDGTAPFANPVKIDNFTIVYNPDKVRDVPGLMDSVLYSYGNVERCFGEYLATSYQSTGYLSDSYVFRTTVEVAGDNSEFRLLSGVGNIPDDATALDWNEGINGLVVIKSPDMLPDFRQVLTYHLTRIAERTIMTNYRSMPEWYLDGVATYVACNMTGEQQNTVMLMATTGKWMTLDELESAYRNMTVYNNSVPEYTNARAQSTVLVDYIGHKYGNRTLAGILKDYTDNGNLTRAFVNYTGYTPEAINIDLKETRAGYAVPSERPDAGSCIDGYMKYADGKPAGSKLISFSGPGTVTNVTTDTAGAYNANLSPGTYRITVPGEVVSGNDTIALKAGDTLYRNVILAGSSPENTPTAPATTTTTTTPSETVPGDLIIPGLIVAVNIVAVLALLAILRRNWH